MRISTAGRFGRLFCYLLATSVAVAFVLSEVFAPDFVLAQAAPKSKQEAPAQPPGPQPAQIDRNGVLILVRSTLLALDHANKTGNYTVLRDLGAPGFQANTAARLAEIFASQRREGLDLSGVAAIDPQLSLLPQIEANGFMRLAGFFPSIPKQVNFEMIFAPVEGRWRLFGLSVSLGEAAPAAPQPSAPPAAPQASPAPSAQPPAGPVSPGVPSPPPNATRKPPSAAPARPTSLTPPPR